jgi:hypothetical protein
VTVPDATGVYTGTSSDLEYRFTTPYAELFTLLRGARSADATAQPVDSIRRESLDPSVPATSVFEAPRIQEYTTTAAHLAAVVLAEDGTASVIAAGADGNGAHSVLLPGVGTVRQLYGSGRSELMGFSYSGSTTSESTTTTSVENVLLVYDPTDGSAVARPVIGLDGAPLQVSDWTFVPGTTSLIAQAYDGSLYIVDAVAATALSALGQHGELRGFLPGSNQLVVADPDGDRLLDLRQGGTEPVEPLRPTSEIGAYPGTRIYLDEQRSTAQLFTTPIEGAGPGQFTSVVAVTDAERSRIVFEPALPGTRIRDFCASPNGQYLAIETAPGDAALDDYPAVAGYAGMTTAIVDIESGVTVRSLYGFLPGWCR